MRTAVFDTINPLKPYFFSLREIKENVSLDLKIPSHWQLGEYNEAQLKIQDKNEKYMLISIIDTSTKDGYNEVFNRAKKIIKTNIEYEEKTKLFNEKVEELKQLFLDAPLDKLKKISFAKDELRDRKSPRETEMGDEKGSGTN